MRERGSNIRRAVSLPPRGPCRPSPGGGGSPATAKGVTVGSTKRPVRSRRQAKPAPARHLPDAWSARPERWRFCIYRRPTLEGEPTMSFHSWLQNFRSALVPRWGQHHHGRRRSLRAATHRPMLEVLEERFAPSRITKLPRTRSYASIAMDATGQHVVIGSTIFGDSTTTRVTPWVTCTPTTAVKRG